MSVVVDIIANFSLGLIIMYLEGFICGQVLKPFNKISVPMLSSRAFLTTLTGLKKHNCSHVLTPNLSVSSRFNSLPDCSSGPTRSSKEEGGWDHWVHRRMLPVPLPYHVTLGKLLTCPYPKILFLPFLSPISHWVCDPSLRPAEVLATWLKELLFWTCCFFLLMLPATKAMVESATILLSRLLISVCCGSWD